jgi:hypothetical protein
LGNIFRASAVLTVEASLQTCHKQGSRDAFSCNIRQYEPDFPRTHIEKIVVVSSYRACLHAVSGVIEGL